MLDYEHCICCSPLAWLKCSSWLQRCWMELFDPHSWFLFQVSRTSTPAIYFNVKKIDKWSFLISFCLLQNEFFSTLFLKCEICENNFSWWSLKIGFCSIFSDHHILILYWCAKKTQTPVFEELFWNLIKPHTSNNYIQMVVLLFHINQTHQSILGIRNTACSTVETHFQLYHGYWSKLSNLYLRRY